MGQERLDLGTEHEGAPRAGIEERPHTEAIAGQEQLPTGGIPDGERPLAVEIRTQSSPRS
jgi:hypothetical protein